MPRHRVVERNVIHFERAAHRLIELNARVRDKKPVTGPTEQWTPDVKEEGHTTSFSIGDAEGNMVCVTQSLGSVFGSGVVV